MANKVITVLLKMKEEKYYILGYKKDNAFFRCTDCSREHKIEIHKL